MANYETHKKIGLTTTLLGIGGVVLYKEVLSQHININLEANILTLVIACFIGYIGSILPDIDLKTSTPSKIFRKFTYILSLSFVSIWFYNNYETIPDIPQENILYIFPILFICTFICNYIFLRLFEKTMVHRGLVHSIPFGIVISIVLYILLLELEYLFSLNINEELISLFLFIGFITHLVLDEVYSIDFNNRKIKSSFGTALKLFDKKNILGNIILYSFIGYFIINTISN